MAEVVAVERRRHRRRRHYPADIEMPWALLRLSDRRFCEADIRKVLSLNGRRVYQTVGEFGRAAEGRPLAALNYCRVCGAIP